jgi:hypothetical protein
MIKLNRFLQNGSWIKYIPEPSDASDDNEANWTESEDEDSVDDGVSVSVSCFDRIHFV